MTNVPTSVLLYNNFIDSAGFLLERYPFCFKKQNIVFSLEA